MEWMKRIVVVITAVLGALAFGSSSTGQTPGQPKPSPAVARTIVQPVADGIFAAFDSYPLVGIDHAVPEEILIALVRDPRFTRTVGNLVVEGGSSFRQNVVDRYLAGDPVPYVQLRTAWGDAIGPVVAGGGFPRLLAAVRTVNSGLPPADRIRVWMGEPPLDWATAAAEDVANAMISRDRNAAHIIVDDILAKGRKALVYYGGFHFSRNFPGGEMLRSYVEAVHPRAFYIVLGYSEIHKPAACEPYRERAAKQSLSLALAAPAPGGTPEPSMQACATLDGADLVAHGMFFSRGDPPVVEGNAVLFAGPPFPLEAGPTLPDALLDDEYRREIARRSRIGGPLPPGFGADLVLRKADYALDIDATGYADRLGAMFAAHDKNGDGVVTVGEYVDPISSANSGQSGGIASPAPVGIPGAFTTRPLDSPAKP
jgi:hypothetical protein